MKDLWPYIIVMTSQWCHKYESFNKKSINGTLSDTLPHNDEKKQGGKMLKWPI